MDRCRRLYYLLEDDNEFDESAAGDMTFDAAYPTFDAADGTFDGED